jgi:hypothetical protein
MDLKFEESADAGSFLIRLKRSNVEAFHYRGYACEKSANHVLKYALQEDLTVVGLFCIFGNSSRMH